MYAYIHTYIHAREAQSICSYALFPINPTLHWSKEMIKGHSEAVYIDLILIINLTCLSLPINIHHVPMLIGLMTPREGTAFHYGKRL